MKTIDRRRFITGALAAAGAISSHGGASVARAATATPAPSPEPVPAPSAFDSAQPRLPREVWIATICLVDMRVQTSAEMVDRTFAEAAKVVAYRPDFVVLPEMFPMAKVPSKNRRSYAEEAQPISGPIVARCREFARAHRCNLVASVLIREGEKSYNATVFLDRSGEVSGVYKKHHLTLAEFDEGLACGRGAVPVIATDVAKVGSQICFDIEWDDGWQSLHRHGAEIVFWPSAFAAGRMVNAKAWQHHYVVVSSTWTGTTKICDVDGEAISVTGLWNKNWAVAPVNLEKAVVKTWPDHKKFPRIVAKYGRSVVIKTHHEEEWSVLESRSPKVKIAEVLKEFGMTTHRSFMARCLEAQRAAGWTPEAG